MIKTIIAVDRDDPGFPTLEIHLEVPNEEFDIMAAVKAAVTDFCQTEAGRSLFLNNGRSIDWVGFELSVPNEFCKKYGFRKVLNVPASIEVDWDGNLVDKSKLPEDLLPPTFVITR